MKEFEALLACLPAPPDYCYNWRGLMQTSLAPQFRAMEETPQDPIWHGEGNVWVHTRMVCEALAALPGFRALPEEERNALSLAALLHDIGKVDCTREEEGRLVAPHHGAKGSQKLRALLWKDFDLAGEDQKRKFREAVCLLVRYHTAPLHLLSNAGGDLRARRLAANGELAPAFHWKALCLLAEADVRGRTCADQQELLDAVELCAEFTREAGCYEAPYAFPSACTAHAYLSGQNIWAQQELYDGSWGEVILLSGLPGTGKDTWIGKNHPEMPVVCLDDIRRAMGIRPDAEQGRVMQAAWEQARVYLRAKQPFIWNATNLSHLHRQKQIGLFEDYKASVRIVYLETPWQENRSRNANRQYAVPEHVLEGMLDRLVLPERFEARSVEWRSN